MDEKISTIKEWLGTGSINIFGLPMSGKDTQGIKLAETLGAKFLSSGMIIRAMEEKTKNRYSDKGALIPTNVFYEWVLPYFERPDLFKYPIVLNISEADVEERFNASKSLNDRGERQDDKDLEIFKTRIEEFREKTAPVIQHYNNLGLLIEVRGDQSREKVFNEIIEKLYEKASKSRA